MFSNRIAAGLMLTETRTRASFRPGPGTARPSLRYKVSDAVTPRLQRVLDALSVSPAIVKTATWDVVAWNAAAAALLTDYGTASAVQAAQHSCA